MSGSYVYEWDSAGDGTFSTDITGYVMSCKTQRGRKDDLGRMPPGTMALVLNNHDGRFSPDKAAGPYFGNLKPYRRVRIKGTVVGASTYGVFYGFVLDWTIKSKVTQQTVRWVIGDRFALWQHMKLNLPLLRKLPVKCALDIAISRGLGGNECANPSVEANLDDYSGLQSVVPARDPTMKIEGDYTVLCDCPGDNAGEGVRYDATGQVTAGKPFLARIWAVASEAVELKFRAYDSVLGERGVGTTTTVGTTPTLLTIACAIGCFQAGSDHYFDLYTTGATEVMFWSDPLYFRSYDSAGEIFRRDLDDGTAEIELAASYRQPALQTLQDIAESEPRSFFFIYCDNSTYLDCLRFRDKDWRATAIAAGPVATFSDDGADVPYFDVLLTERAAERISEAAVRSQGDFEDDNESLTIWELLPTGYEIPAAATLVLHALYSQPARDCSMTLNSPDATPRPFDAEGSGDDDDGFLTKYGDEYPPLDGPSIDVAGHHAWIGQFKVGVNYYVYRPYLAFDTAPIPDAAAISATRLRLKLTADFSTTNFDIEVRLHTWSGGGLTGADWRAGDPPGADTLLGTFNTADLPPAGEWFEVDIDETQINKTGNTEMYLHSARDPGTAPTGNERISIATSESGDAPQLIVTYDYGPQSETFENYGVGARIAIEAPADAPVIIDTLILTGIPLRGSSEDSEVVAASTNPAAIERTLTHALPLQGTRTSSMETEADRQANRYDDDDPPKRISLILRPKNDVVLTQMLAREIGELIHVENINDPYSTYIDGNFWIQGIDHDITVRKHTVIHKTVFHLEEA